MPTIGGGHRMPSLPAPPRPKTGPNITPAPARPGLSAPPGHNYEVYDRMFEAEFDPEVIPDQADAKSKMKVCESSNMEYIKSALPATISPAMYDHQQFFMKMAKHQWRMATGPSAQNLAAGLRGMVRPAGGHRDLGAKPMLQDRSRPGFAGEGNLGRTTNWDKIPGLERVNAYAFRGEKREPNVIRAAGGFQPGSMRTDDYFMAVIAREFKDYMTNRFGMTVDETEVKNYVKGQAGAGRVFVEYQIWRAILKGEEMHIGKMVMNEFLKGYISTSRNVFTAYNFYKDTSKGGLPANGGVYALHTEGGFLLPDRVTTKHAHGSKQNEAEIAHPGPLPWSKVVAFRPFNKTDWNDTRTFKQPSTIYLRKGWKEKDPEGARHVFYALGGLGYA